MVTLPDLVGFDPIVLKGDQGDSGEKGDTGATGATPNLTLGTVTTLPPDQAASASISGSPTNPVLTLQIPQGVPGGAGGAPLKTIGSVVTS